MFGLDRPEVRALIALGAESVTEAEDGSITHLPEDLDLSGYDAALAAAAAEIASEVPAKLKAYAADKRWLIETGGILVGNESVATDRASQGMIAGAKALSDEEPGELVDYKAASGWVQVDAATMGAIALAVGRHVRACFRIERQVCDAIDAGTITTNEEIDAADWPANVT